MTGRYTALVVSTLSHARRTTLMALVAILTLDASCASTPARADVRSSGPIVAVGFAEKLRKELIIPTVGWRWQLGAGQTLGGWGNRAGLDLSFVIEPSVAGIFGDKRSFETQLVPLIHLEPVTRRSWAPYFEAGVGLIYTALDGVHLGSHVLFSDNFGGGVSFDLASMPVFTRLSLGYRFRHISHAGIFGNTNSGLNTHYLTVTFQ